MHEFFKTEDEITYEDQIVKAIARATLSLVKICPVQQLHDQEKMRIAKTPTYEYI